MALSRIDESDRKLGQAVAQANGSTAFIPAVMGVDSAGNPTTTDSLTTALAASTPVSCSGYGTALIQVKTLAAGDSISVLGTVDGTNYVTLAGINLNTNASSTSITADGIYAFQAVGSIEYTKSGANGSSQTVALMLKR